MMADITTQQLAQLLLGIARASEPKEGGYAGKPLVSLCSFTAPRRLPNGGRRRGRRRLSSALSCAAASSGHRRAGDDPSAAPPFARAASALRPPVWCQ